MPYTEATGDAKALPAPHPTPTPSNDSGPQAWSTVWRVQGIRSGYGPWFSVLNDDQPGWAGRTHRRSSHLPPTPYDVKDFNAHGCASEADLQAWFPDGPAPGYEVVRVTVPTNLVTHYEGQQVVFPARYLDHAECIDTNTDPATDQDLSDLSRRLDGLSLPGLA